WTGGPAPSASIVRARCRCPRACVRGRGRACRQAGSAAARIGLGWGETAIHLFEGGGRGLQFAALVEQLDPPLRLFEPCVAEAGELDAALVERQRLLEGEVAVLELLHDRFELGDGGLEVFNGRVGHRTFSSLVASGE